MDFTESRLEDAQFNLETRISETEYVDSAWAIMAFESQKYAYETALKMGGSVITPSFIDFMT
jgi:flagellar hook-associated protein 3 FlgL